MKYEWDRGEISEFATLAEVGPSFLSDLFQRRRTAGGKVAKRLVTASIAMHTKNRAFPVTTVEQWLYPDEYDNPLLP